MNSEKSRTATKLDTSALEAALESNRRLQASILQELQDVASQKADNRAHAARLTKDIERSLRFPTTSHPLSKPNPYGISMDRFFADPRKKKNIAPEPEANADTVRRRSLEHARFSRFLLPWSQPEEKRLLSIVQKMQGEKASSQGDHGAIDLDYDVVASRLKETYFKKDGMVNPHMKDRTADECRIRHEQLTKKDRPLSKEEIFRLSEMVHDAKLNNNENLDWKQIAASLEDRTPWECFVAYQTRISPVEPEDWSVEEDELLLKYFCAGGPQQAVDKTSVARFLLTTRVNKSRKQVLQRINTTLLNPKLKRGGWSIDAERRLAILMKMHQGDVFKVSTHFSDRSRKVVTDKWERTLTPDYDYRPFSTEEDKAILDITQAPENKQSCLLELAREHFPDRHPQRIKSRWYELVKNDDAIVQRESASNKRKKSAQLFNPDQFVVQITKKKKSTK